MGEYHHCEIDVDIDCAECFNATLDSLRSHPDVRDVSGSISDGTIRVSHTGDAAPILELIHATGHRWMEAPNGEMMLDEVHAHHRHTR